MPKSEFPRDAPDEEIPKWENVFRVAKAIALDRHPDPMDELTAEALARDYARTFRHSYKDAAYRGFLNGLKIED